MDTRGQGMKRPTHRGSNSQHDIPGKDGLSRRGKNGFCGILPHHPPVFCHFLQFFAVFCDSFFSLPNSVFPLMNFRLWTPPNSEAKHGLMLEEVGWFHAKLPAEFSPKLCTTGVSARCPALEQLSLGGFIVNRLFSWVAFVTHAARTVAWSSKNIVCDFAGDGRACKNIPSCFGARGS